jgi:HK97 gp10 family phage protein
VADVEWDDAAIDELMSPGGEMHKELQRRATKVVRRAKRLCPVDTGRLRSSITHDEVERRGRTTLVVRVGTNVEYAAYVELGTSRQRSQPYLRPALDAAR